MVVPEDLDTIATQQIGLRDYFFHEGFGKGTGVPRALDEKQTSEA